jgi:predicted RNA binding protein YcfA (HicA-like mRNA interferase family)
MPKLPPLTSQKVIRILEKKGFVLARTKGSHQIYWNELSRRQVTVPLHTCELPIGTLLEILKQAGISRDEFIHLI